MLNTFYQLQITHIKTRLTELYRYNCCWQRIERASAEPQLQFMGGH